eukprot:NODE_693_length_5110_cov_0.285572.p2 type:complete len:224 gc:universal NODE_693_length_5110_cov_0.285572:2379-3050(+)
MFFILVGAALYGKLMNSYTLYVSLCLLNVSKVVDMLIVHVSILFCVSLDTSHYVEKSFDSEHPEIEHEIYHVYVTILVCILSVYQAKPVELQFMNMSFQQPKLIASLISIAHIMAVVLDESSVFILVLGLMGYTSFNILVKIFDVLLNRIHSFHPIHDQIQHQIQVFTGKYHCNVRIFKIIRSHIDKVLVVLSVDQFIPEYQQFFNKFIKVGDVQLEFDVIQE